MNIECRANSTNISNSSNSSNGSNNINSSNHLIPMNFELIDHEYIQLNQLLKLLGLVETGGEANQRILDGQVKVNHAVEFQKRKKLRKGDVVTFLGKVIEIK